MDRAAVLALVAVLVATSLGPGLAAGHANHLSLDPQVSNGSVVVERLFVSAPAVLVLHDTDRPGGAGLGAPVGERAVTPGRGVGVAVPVDDAAWESWNAGESRRIRAVLHRDDDDDGVYDPGDDPALTTFGSLADANATVRRGARPWYVVAAEPDSSLANRSLSLRHVAVGAPGGVVVRAGERVVASRALSTGGHDGVAVSLSPGVNATALDGADLTVALYADDGDGRYDSADRTVTAGGAPVATRLRARPGGDGRVVTPERTGTTGDAATDRESTVPGAGTGAAAGALAVVLAAALALVVRRL